MGELDYLHSEALASAQDFRDLANSIPQIVWISGPDGGDPLFLNDRYYEYTGLPREIPGIEGWGLVVHPDDKPNAYGLYAEAIRSSKPWVCELRLKSDKGEYRWHLSRALPIWNDRGRLIRWVATSTDIHDQKLAEQELKRARDRNRFLLRLNDLVRTIRDPEEVVQRTVRAICKHLKVNRCTFAEVDQQAGTIRRLASYNQGVGPGQETYQISSFGAVAGLIRSGKTLVANDVETDPRMQGEPAAVLRAVDVRSVVAVPILSDGQVTAIFAIVDKKPRDWASYEVALIEELAERTLLSVQNARSVARIRELNHELERRVQERTAELTDALQRLEAFSYTTSHDLRAPLRAIAARNHILLEDFADALPAEALDHLHVQTAQAKRMSELIDALLRYSRLSKEELIREEIDLSALAEESASEVLAQFAGAGHETQIQPGLLAQGDPRLVKLVLVNLIENAVKFSPAGGKVGVYSAGLNGSSVYVVEDSGIGFDMKFADKLWLPFNRLVGQDEFPGTGIGLAQVQRIVQRHGGKVWAQSELGKGSKFYFSLG